MILVTGGTGLVGSHLLYFLLKENDVVRAIHRKESNLQRIKEIFKLYTEEPDAYYNRIDWQEADITDIPALENAFQGVTEVYHCAAYISFNPAKYSKLKKINVEGTANIVNLSIHYQIQKLCFVSSVATLSRKPDQNLANESSFWNPDEKNSVYAITKYGAEMEVWRGTQEGLEAIIVNPAVILGVSPDNDGSGIAMDLGSRGIPFYPSGGIGIVDVRDVVKIMIRLMKSDVKNERFVLVSANVTIRELLTSLAKLFGKKSPSKKLPRMLMNFISSVDWFSSKIFGTKRRIPKDTVRSMYSISEYDNAKIREALDYSFIPLQETLEYVVKHQPQN